MICYVVPVDGLYIGIYGGYFGHASFVKIALG